MKITLYKSQYKNDCIEIFRSNLDIFFADYEMKEFEEFITYHAERNPYYIVLDESEIIACGGFKLVKDIINLSWGMVRRDHHNKGIGKHLLLHRLHKINEIYPHKQIEIVTSQHSCGFFQKFGFVVKDVVKDGIDIGLDNVTMAFKN